MRCLIIIVVILTLISTSYAYNTIRAVDSAHFESLLDKSKDLRLHDIDSAIAISTNGLKLADSLGSRYYRGQFLLSISACNLYKADYLKAMQDIQESYTIFEELQDENGLNYSCYYLALANFYLEHYDKSEELYLQSLDYFIASNDSVQISKTYNNIALIGYMRSDWDFALKYLKLAANVKRKLNMTKSLILTNNNMGEIYFSIGDLDSARILYTESIKLSKNLQARSIIASAHMGLAKVHLHTQITPKTLYHLNTAHNNILELQNREMQRSVNLHFTTYYEKKNDYKKALQHYKQFHDLSDSLLNKEKQQAIEELRIKFNTENKNKEIKMLKEHELLHKRIIKQQKKINIIAVGASIFILIALILYIVLFSRQKQLNKILREKNKQIKEKNAKLKELNHTKDRFFSIIAHDLKTPFSAIMGFSELLLKRGDKLPFEKIKKYVDQIHISSKNLFILLENLLTWSRAQTDGLKPKNDYFNLSVIVLDVINVLKSNALNKGNNIVSNIPTDLVLYSDANMVSAIMRNLITNANKFTHGGTITIDLLWDHNNCEISVQDTGIGLTEEQITNFFNFSKIKSTPGTNGEKGTGLGIHMCYELSKALKGNIKFESTYGEGTLVRLTIPGSSS
ncbi:MAG: tetratricopeptide repeat-containing sensor histidine kinase [Bacteroidales bacterium]|nr:tetratricopeptide repeat-containing sensor histidine kinase [Bacteroidales bacterium]